MKIFCDLDGTLIDVSTRHYKVYSEVTLKLGGSPLSKEEYWVLKRQKVKWSKLLPMSNLQESLEPDFLRKFIEKIEDPEYLSLDTLFPESIMAIDQLSKLGDIYLVSLRRNRENLLDEITHLKIKKYFTEILTGHSESDGYDVKISLIKDRLGGDKGVIIGDTEADVVTGKKLGITSIALSSGIRDERFLVELQPDYMLESIGDVSGLLSKL